MTDNFEKKVAVDGPVVNAGELGSSTFSPGQALPAGPLGLGQRWTVARKRGPITKIMPSDGCIGDTVPLAVGKWYDFHEFGWYMGNVGLTIQFNSDGSIIEW